MELHVLTQAAHSYTLLITHSTDNGHLSHRVLSHTHTLPFSLPHPHPPHTHTLQRYYVTTTRLQVARKTFFLIWQSSMSETCSFLRQKGHSSCPLLTLLFTLTSRLTSDQTTSFYSMLTRMFKSISPSLLLPTSS